MKKLIFIIICMFIFLCFSPVSSIKHAKADEIYAMVTAENAPFYSDSSKQMIKFYLPYSYYVKVVDIGTDFSRVKFMDGGKGYPSCEGYVSNADLNFSLTPSNSPYPDITLTLKNDDVIFSDSTLSNPRAVLMGGSTAVYYGNLSVGGEDYVYVYSGGYIGYVRLASLSDFTIPLHADEHLLHIKEEPTSETPPEENQDQKPKNQSSENSMKIVIIFVVLIASLCLIFLILKPNQALSAEHSFFNDD